MSDAGLRVKEAGFELSQYVMPGLGGRAASHQHALNTARVLNAIDPHFTRVRTLMLAPGTPLRDEYERGEFEPLPRREILEEIAAMVGALDVTGRLCFDHMANPPIFRQDWDGYKLPEEKEAVLAPIREALGAAER
jgi:radical SAM superfamily enzyme